MPEAVLIILALAAIAVSVVAIVMVVKLSSQLKIAEEALVEDRCKIAQITRAISARPGNDPVDESALNADPLNSGSAYPDPSAMDRFASAQMYSQGLLDALNPQPGIPIPDPSGGFFPIPEIAGQMPPMDIGGMLPQPDMNPMTPAMAPSIAPPVSPAISPSAPPSKRGSRKDKAQIQIPYGENKIENPNRASMVPPMNPALSRAGAQARQKANVIREKEQISAVWAAEEERRIQEQKAYEERLRRKNILHNDVPDL